MRIVEILDRSTQGITRPFICRGGDGAIYYVKGRHAGYRALCCEWIAGELARLRGLPVVPFAIVDVPSSLVRGSIREDAAELRGGMAFGSRQVESAVELRWKEVEGGHIAVDLRARVLLFDWWVNNPDHILSSTGGNPNLLWATAEQQLHLIDHNLAFSPNMMSASLFDFATEHVFGADLLVDEARFWEEPESKLGPLTNATIELDTFWQQNRRELPRIWNDLPEEWTEATLGFTLEEVQQQLDRINMQFEDFWGTSTTTEGAEEG